MRTHHVPCVVCKPVDDTVYSAHTLQVLSFDGPLVYEEHNETRGNKGHGSDDEDCNKNVRASQAANTRIRGHLTGRLRDIPKLHTCFIEICYHNVHVITQRTSMLSQRERPCYHKENVHVITTKTSMLSQREHTCYHSKTTHLFHRNMLSNVAIYLCVFSSIVIVLLLLFKRLPILSWSQFQDQNYT